MEDDVKLEMGLMSEWPDEKVRPEYYPYRRQWLEAEKNAFYKSDKRFWHLTPAQRFRNRAERISQSLKEAGGVQLIYDATCQEVAEFRFRTAKKSLQEYEDARVVGRGFQ